MGLMGGMPKPVNVRKVFKKHCGTRAKYVSSGFENRGEFNTVTIQFEIVPEGRKFNLDGVIHEPCGREQVEAAVVRIAGIAMSVRQHIDMEA